MLAVRETPLHTGHLRTMTALSEMGAVIAPIMPAFYNRPQTLDDIVNHSVGRMLDLFGIETSVVVSAGRVSLLPTLTDEMATFSRLARGGPRINLRLTMASLTSEDLRIASRIAIFAGLKPETVARLITPATIVTLKHGECLFHQGDPALAFFIIVERLDETLPDHRGGRRGDHSRLDQG